MWRLIITSPSLISAFSGCSFHTCKYLQSYFYSLLIWKRPDNLNLDGFPVVLCWFDLIGLLFLLFCLYAQLWHCLLVRISSTIFQSVNTTPALRNTFTLNKHRNDHSKRYKSCVLLVTLLPNFNSDVIQTHWSCTY